MNALPIMRSEDQRSYREKLKDGRWIRLRDRLFQAAGYRCEECGTTHDLQGHHVFYIVGKDPWDYPLQLLMCLCSEHHRARHAVEEAIMINVATVLRDKKLPELKTLPIWTFFEGLDHFGGHP